MIIKTMDASFGGLENAHMEFEPGLNIIEAPMKPENPHGADLYGPCFTA